MSSAKGFPDIRAINAMLAPMEEQLIRDCGEPKHPVLFVLPSGPRCGHSLFTQLLAASGSLWTPSNFIAPFWEAPVLGALLRKALSAGPRRGFHSDLGKTSNLDDPHEFGMFLQRWLPLGNDHVSRRPPFSTEEITTFRKEIAALEAINGLPVFLRNLIYCLNIRLIHQLIPNAVFALCRRDPVCQAQSILITRKKEGDVNAWWSLRPEGFERLLDDTPEEQIAWQIWKTLDTVHGALRELERETGQVRHVEIAYEDVCQNPAREVCRALELVHGPGATPAADLPQSFECSNVQKLPDEEFARVKRAVADRGL